MTTYRKEQLITLTNAHVKAFHALTERVFEKVFAGEQKYPILSKQEEKKMQDPRTSCIFWAAKSGLGYSNREELIFID